jgi:hypothetical protein
MFDASPHRDDLSPEAEALATEILKAAMSAAINADNEREWETHKRKLKNIANSPPVHGIEPKAVQVAINHIEDLADDMTPLDDIEPEPCTLDTPQGPPKA